MPLNFGDRPGGWLIAHMSGGQALEVFFYGDAVGAERAQREASFPLGAGPVRTIGNVIYGYRKQPTGEQADVLESCLRVPASS
jgi:hypothetical protein